MKIPTIKKLRFIPALLGLLILGSNAKAQYFDVNGSAAGYGIANGAGYLWDDPNWGVSGGGGATTFWTAGGFARFYGGTSGQSYTVTVTNSESMAGLWQHTAGVTVTLNATGAGELNIVPVAGGQGFLISGPIVINAPLTGGGGIAPETFSGSPAISLYGNNTYSGGTFFGYAGSPLTFFNNNNSFGTGPVVLTYGAGSFAAILSQGGAPITLPNAFTNATSGGGINFANGASTPVICTGNWSLAGNNTLIRNNGNSTAPLTLSGVISGTAGVTFSGNNGGTIFLAGTNTYTGLTTVGFGSAAGTLVVTTNGSLAGNVTVNTGRLELDKPTAFASNAVLSVVSTLASGAVNLNFSGTQVVSALFIDGSVAAGGTWGSPTSGAQNTSAIFGGTGIINVLGPPLIIQQPQSIARYPGASGTFSVGVAGASPFTYQWKFNSANIAGATDSSYTIPSVSAADVGTYSVAVANSFGNATSSNATLSILATNCYVSSIMADSPISYWRLGETTGTLAQDGAGNSPGSYVNVSLNQPGISPGDTNGSIGMPASAGRAYVSVANSAPVAFPGVTPFALEAWVNFTSFGGVQRIFSTFSGSSPSWGYAFGISENNVLRFTTSTIQDADVSLSSPLAAGVWYHLVVTSDSGSYHFYVNGVEVGTGVLIQRGGNTGTSAPLQLGGNPASYSATAIEQLKGQIDEAAIYGFLTPDQVLAHYNARYCSVTTPGAGTPVASPGTNYVSLTAQLQAVASGQALSYQWYKGATLLAGKTDSTLTLSPLQLSDAGNYNVQVSNPSGSTNSPSVLVGVLPIPTNAAQLNLTNSLVLHLPFDGDYTDISGHSNNGTNVGATTFVSPGAIGTNGLHYSSDTSVSNFNYVTLGVRSDLQFSNNVDFTVSYWVRQDPGSTYTNLPFFTDAIGSTAQGGFAFAPYAGTGGGGWMWTIGTVTSPNAATTFPDANLINDGNWHHLVHVAKRSANCTTYLDGVQVDSQSIVVVGNINTSNPATIGQDPTGAYPVTASADIDDLAVWQRILTPLEVSGMFLAGATNKVSFAPPVAAPIVRAALQLQQVSPGQYQLTWTGTGGALQASPDVAGTYTNVPGATSPYTISTAGSQLFYRLKY